MEKKCDEHGRVCGTVEGIGADVEDIKVEMKSQWRAIDARTTSTTFRWVLGLLIVLFVASGVVKTTLTIMQSNQITRLEEKVINIKDDLAEYKDDVKKVLHKNGFTE